MNTIVPGTVLLVLCSCFVGCKGPSIDERSPTVSGRVLDAQTHQPLQGARVSLHAHPGIATVSDASGSFRLHGTKNFHLFTILGICSTSFPEGKYYGDTVDFTAVGYVPLEIDARKYLPPDAMNSQSSCLTLRDILLTQIIR
jgi:hypothetical protein